MKSRGFTVRRWLSGGIQRARRKIWRRNSPSPVGKIDFGKLRHKVLLGQNVGCGNAQGAGSYYIEHFLRREAAAAKGRILKIGNDHHAEFLRGRHIQSVTSLPLTDDGRLLSEMAALRDNSYDTLFLTHVLQFIYDLDAAIRHAHRILSPGGVLLATVPGTCQASRQINESQPYWRFTSVSLRTLIESVFPPQGINIESFGNVFVAIADMHQLAASELSERELKHRDNHYPLVVTLKAEKSTDDVSCDR